MKTSASLAIFVVAVVYFAGLVSVTDAQVQTF
jgi:hypothetical protein